MPMPGEPPSRFGMQWFTMGRGRAAVAASAAEALAAISLPWLNPAPMRSPKRR